MKQLRQEGKNYKKEKVCTKMNLLQSAIVRSMLRGRTAFSIYRFDNRDRAYVITLFVCLTLTVMAALLGLTDMVYDPLIIWEPILETDILFCIGYAVLCLMPLILELWTDYRFSTTI